MNPKLYCVADMDKTKQVACLVVSAGEWHTKYLDSYITQEYRARIMKRFDDAMKAKGYTRIGYYDIPRQYKRVKGDCKMTEGIK